MGQLNRAQSFSNSNAHPAMLKRKQSSRMLLDIQNENTTIAEIRNVTVLFIKIDIPNMELLVDNSQRRENLSDNVSGTPRGFATTGAG